MSSEFSDKIASRFTIALLSATSFMPGCVSIDERNPSMETEDFEFVSGGKTLSGIIDQPASGQVQALMVFVHGSGPTNVREENRYIDLRRRFTGLGIACVVWDKPGLGRSEGEYDPNQPLVESAREVLDAVATLRDRRVPGSNRIGIWGTSRGGWVAPIALSQDPGIEFWISVSGVPADDNKYYLMKSNLPLEGRTPEETDRIMEEWKHGRQLFFRGSDYDAYLAATENLRCDTSVFYFAGDLTGSREAYEAEQNVYMQAKEKYEFDEETLSLVQVQDFSEMLSALEIDVLALFGDKDTNVDWRRARALYQSTIGQQANATLTIRTFAGCDHAMNQSITGSVRAVDGTPLDSGAKCNGYYETQMEWLRAYVVTE